MKTILLLLVCLFSMGANYQQTMQAQKVQHNKLMAQARIDRAAESKRKSDAWEKQNQDAWDRLHRDPLIERIEINGHVHYLIFPGSN